MREEIEERLGCWLSVELEDAIAKFIEEKVVIAQDKLEKKIHNVFVKKYQGAGEVWFPYESAGNCTKQEEVAAVENEWNSMMEDIHKDKKVVARVCTIPGGYNVYEKENK